MTHEAPPTPAVLFADRFQRVCPIHGIKLTGNGDELDCRYGHKVKVHSVLDTVKGKIVASSEPDPPTTAARTAATTGGAPTPGAAATSGTTGAPATVSAATPRPAPAPQSPQPRRRTQGRRSGEAPAIANRAKWKALGKSRFIEPNGETLTLNLLQRGEAFKVSWTTVLYRTAAEGEGNARDKIQSCGLAGRFEKRSEADAELEAQRALAASYGWQEQAYDPREPFRFAPVPRPGALRARGKTKTSPSTARSKRRQGASA